MIQITSMNEQTKKQTSKQYPSSIYRNIECK